MLQLNKVKDTSGKRFLSTYLGSKRKVSSQVVELIDNQHFKVIYDLFGGSGSLACAFAPYCDTMIYNERNKYLSSFIWNAYWCDDFEEFWKSTMEYYVDNKEDYMALREEFNKTSDKPYLVTVKPLMYFWLNYTCTSALVRWNKNKSTEVGWYFNQAYCGKKASAEWAHDVLKEGLELFPNKKLRVSSQDYKSVKIEPEGSLVLLDPPYDNVYNGYIPEEWSSQDFVDYVNSICEKNKCILFGATTKPDTLEDTMNLKPFFDKGWKLKILTEDAFKSVSPNTKGNQYSDVCRENKKTNKKYDVCLYNF